MSQSDYPLRMKVPLLLCVCFSYTQGAINYNILFWSDLSHHSIEGLQRAKMVYLCSVSRDWSFCLWSGFILDPAWCDPCCAWGCHVKFPIMKKPLSSKTVPVFEEVFWKPGNRGCNAEAQGAGCRTHMTRLGRKSLPSGRLVLGNIMGNFPSPET